MSKREEKLLNELGVLWLSVDRCQAMLKKIAGDLDGSSVLRDRAAVRALPSAVMERAIERARAVRDWKAVAALAGELAERKQRRAG